MRVALLSQNARLHNAVGNQIAERVRFFQERGAEVRVLVQDARQLHPDLRSCTTEVSVPTLSGPAWEFLRDADLVLAAYAQAHSLLQYLPLLRERGTRVVFDYFGVTPPELWGEAQREGIVQSARERGYVWNADHALTMGDANYRELVQATGFSGGAATILPLPVDVDRFQGAPRDRFLRSRIGAEGPIVLFVGRLAPNKRVPLLIEALARLHDRSVQLAIVGDCRDVYATEAARCLGLALERNVADRVHFLGELSDADLPRAYRSADVFAMPSAHEGFCVPVVEAMASGCPVIASRATALMETVGDAGLTFQPDDASDLARQLTRVLASRSSSAERGGVDSKTRSRRIAIVSFRFGPDIVGGAEASLRTMGQALLAAGHLIEVFTTCTRTESHWQNDFAPGTVTLDGLKVHRFPIDPHDASAHGEAVRAIVETEGESLRSLGDRYLAESIHSGALIAALRGRNFDAILVGPYLFGLTADVVREFGDKTLVVPCFHDEALARLPQWPEFFGTAGGILFHSIEEQQLAQARLGVNHPNSTRVGTLLARPTTDHTIPKPAALRVPYVVYCGRYSEQKNVTLLIEWMRRVHAVSEKAPSLVFMGQGEIVIPREPWLHDLGRVDEATKHAVLAGASALVQLSRQESLSLVALEAWQAGTPVIVHRDCAVLMGQVERSQGGLAVGSFPEFQAAIDDLHANPAAWQIRGERGKSYVASEYASPDRFVDRILRCVDTLQVPISVQMRERGPERARRFARSRWRERFADFVERILLHPPRPMHRDLTVESLHSAISARSTGSPLLVPVRLCNQGTDAAVPEGPGRTTVVCEIRTESGEPVNGTRTETTLPGLLLPGRAQAAVLALRIPGGMTQGTVCLWMQTAGKDAGAMTVVPITTNRPDMQCHGAGACLDTVQEILPRAHQLRQLPAEYVDVTEGALAPVKRFVKRKVLHNFKHAYVDVLSRQQSQVNGHLILMIQQLTDCCAVLNHAVAELHQRIDALESKIETLSEAGDSVEEAANRRSHG